MHETFGGRVKRLRLARGLREEALAVAMEVSFNTIWKVERNIMGMRAERIPRLARALGVTCDYLLEPYARDAETQSATSLVPSGGRTVTCVEHGKPHRVRGRADDPHPTTITTEIIDDMEARDDT